MREAKYTVSGSRLTEQMKLKDVRAAELAVDTGISPALLVNTNPASFRKALQTAVGI